MSAYAKDMTKGSELKVILGFTLPLLAGNLFQQLYNIADSVIVGKILGSDAFAAVGATGSITYLFYTLCIGLATGAGIIIAQSFGSGDGAAVKRITVNSAYVLCGFGLALSLISVTAAPGLLRLLDTPENVIDTSISYMRISCGGTLAVAMYNWINAVMRSLGDSRTPLVFLMIASVLNVLLDLLFVLVLDLGVNGAAWATVTAQALAAAGCTGFAFLKNPCFKFRREDMRPDRRECFRCIRVGIPIALQNAMISVSMVFLQRTANRFGDTVMAAYTATMRVEQLIQQPFSSLNAALSAFTGQNIGAGERGRVVNGYRQSVRIALIFAAAAAAVFLICADKIMGFFVNEREVIDIGAGALRLSCCFYVFLGLIHTTRGLLNGAGDTDYAMINGFAEVAGRIGFALILGSVSAVGYWAVWGTTCLTWFITAVMSLARYKQGKWKNKLV